MKGEVWGVGSVGSVGVWAVECGLWSVGCGVWGVECGVWGRVFGVLRLGKSIHTPASSYSNSHSNSPALAIQPRLQPDIVPAQSCEPSLQISHRLPFVISALCLCLHCGVHRIHGGI